MNDQRDINETNDLDTAFFAQFQQTPRSEFAQSLHETIKQEAKQVEQILNAEKTEDATGFNGIKSGLNPNHRPREMRLTLAAAILALIALLVLLLLTPRNNSTIVAPETTAEPQPHPTHDGTTLNYNRRIEIEAGKGPVTQVYWSPDGQTLALAGEFGIALYAADDLMTPLAELPIPIRVIQPLKHLPLQFSPDGSLLAIYDPAQGLFLWDVRRNVRSYTLTFEVKRDSVTITNASVAYDFSPDGRFIAFERSDLFSSTPYIDFVDLQTGHSVGTFTPPPYSWIGGMKFSPDSQQLAVLNGNRSVMMLKSTDGLWTDSQAVRVISLEAVIDWEQRSDFVTGLAFTPAGDRLALWFGRNIAFFDLDNGSEVLRIAAIDNPISIPRDRFPTEMIFSADGKRLTTLSDRVREWDTQTGERLREFTELSMGRYGAVLVLQLAVAFNPDFSQIAYITPEHVVQIRDPQTGEILAQQDAYTLGEIHDLQFSPDGSRLLSVDTGGVHIWKSRDGGQFEQHLSSDLSNVMRPLIPPGTFYWENPFNAAFSPDSTAVTVANERGQMQRISLTDQTSEPLLDLALPDPDAVSLIAWKPENSLALVRTEKPNAFVLQLHHVETGEVLTLREMGAVHGETRVRTPEIFSPDGRLVAVAFKRSEPIDELVWGIHVWDTATGELITTLPGTQDNIREMAFTPDNQTIITTNFYGTTRFHNLKTGLIDLTIPYANMTQGMGLRMSGDGRVLALQIAEYPQPVGSPTGGRGVYGFDLYDTRSGAKLGRFVPSDGVDPFSPFALNHDGSMLAFLNQSRQLELWSVQ